MEPGPFLSCRTLDVGYAGVQVLFGVDFDVERGEIVALLGTNGAGKSTLLRAISGLVHPSSGTIVFDGRVITEAEPHQTARMGIVHVPGGRSVFPTMTVSDHFKAASWLLGGDCPDVSARTDEVLQRFPHLQRRQHTMAGNLSGGEQQMLGLGMAFLARPKLLVIDELSLGLAPAVVELLLDMVRAIHTEGSTIVLVEQSVNLALTLAQRAYFMEKGEVRFQGPAPQLLEQRELLRSVFLEGAAAALPGAAPSRDVSLRGRDARTADADADAAQPPLLEVRGLSRSFGGVVAVDGVSFALQPHGILGFIGPNGAGKTTLFDMISGLLPVGAGEIRLRDRDITRWSAPRRAMAGLGRSFQDAQLFPSLTVAENLAIGLERHVAVRDHLAAMLALPAIQESERQVAFAVGDLVELFGLGNYRDKFVGELSTGSRRIVDLAMALAHDPDVLLLDEPSSGIAQRETEALVPLLRRVRSETGCALLVIEHDMPLITTLADELIALDLGRVIARGRPDQVVNDREVVRAYLGGDVAAIQRSGVLGGIA
ncbi:MAG TPA: ATP-binding cassette domain-containing protein [Candidatus Dormibacteraeota bacterium]|nr:ATP-binding cassette domain-containing protein [Candidatus Dormibacteraeota bacterium]